MKHLHPALRLAGLALIGLVTAPALAGECNTSLLPQPIFELLEQEKYSKAEAAARAAAAAQPDSLEAQQALAHVLINSALRHAVSLDNTKLGFAEGESGTKSVTSEQMQAAMQDTYVVDAAYAAKAEAQVEQLLRRWPEQRDLNYCLTKMHYYSRDHARFLVSLRKTALAQSKNGPEAVDFLIGYAGKYYEEGDYLRASDTAQVLVDVFPHSAAAISTLGVTRLRRYDSKGALALFERAYKEDPSDLIVVGNIAETALLRGDAAKARQFLQKKVKLQPEHTSSYFDLAMVSMQQGPKHSLSAWDGYLAQHKLHPDSEQWANNALAIRESIAKGMEDDDLLYLAQQFIEIGTPKYAVPVLYYLKGKQPHAAATYRLAHAYDRSENYDLAEAALLETLQRLRQPQPQDSVAIGLDEVRYNLARYTYSMDRNSEALAYLEQMDKGEAHYADTGYMYSLVYLKDGKTDQAKAVLKRCVEQGSQEQIINLCKDQLKRAQAK